MIITKLIDYNHFVDLTNKFDYQHNTKTFLLKTTLAKCNDLFLKKNVFAYLDSLVKNIFKKQSIIQSNDQSLKTDDTVKLYTFYHIVKDIQNNIGIKHPLNLHYFGNNKVALSPGIGRIFFYNQYDKDVDIIVTDYTKNFCNDYSITTYEIVENKFNCIDLSFLDAPVQRNSPRALWKIVKKNIRYKQCIDCVSIDNWGTVKNKIEFYLYEYKDNAVYVNNHKIIYKKNNNWYFNV